MVSYAEFVEDGEIMAPSSLGGAPVPRPTYQQEQSGFVGIGQIVLGGARKALDQRFLVTPVVGLKWDRGDDDKDALIAAVVCLRDPHFGCPGEGMRECHLHLPHGDNPGV